MEDFPHYGMITQIEDFVVQKIQEIWTMTEQVRTSESLEMRSNLQLLLQIQFVRLGDARRTERSNFYK